MKQRLLFATGLTLAVSYFDPKLCAQDSAGRSGDPREESRRAGRCGRSG